MKRKRVQHRKGPKVERVPPTPETVAKLQPDPLIRLLDGGTITNSEYIAALNIREAYKLITQGCEVRASGYEFRDKSYNGTEGERAARLQIQYKKWCERIEPKHIGVVTDYVVEEFPLRDLGSRHRMDWRKAKRIVRRGLGEYAGMMGWA